jgi:hypothetical protein
MFVGFLDMAYAFLLFWPANVLPVPVLLVLMQLFIPLNTLLGKWFCGRNEFGKHMMISGVIILSSLISYLSLIKDFRNE